MTVALIVRYVLTRSKYRPWSQCDYLALGHLLNNVCFVVAVQGLLYAYYRQDMDSSSVTSGVVLFSLCLKA